MAATVSVTLAEQTDNGWLYDVSVDEHQYSVTLSKNYYHQLTNGSIKPEELVERSFEFLLLREPPQAILSKFDLPEIGSYFPEYEDVIKST